MHESRKGFYPRAKIAGVDMRWVGEKQENEQNFDWHPGGIFLEIGLRCVSV